MTQLEEYEALVEECAREAYREHRADYPWAQEWFAMSDDQKQRWRRLVRAVIAVIEGTK